MRFDRIAVETVIEEALARKVMIDADDVGRAGPLADIRMKGFEFVSDASGLNVAPHRVPTVNPPGQEIECQPAPRVLEPRLIGDRPSAVRASQVVRLHELRGWIDPADGAHRGHRAANLM